METKKQKKQEDELGNKLAQKVKKRENYVGTITKTQKHGWLFGVDGRLVDAETFSLYTGLENYYDKFIHNFDNFKEAHGIINTILGIKSLKNKAFKAVKNGKYIPDDVIHVAQMIFYQKPGFGKNYVRHDLENSIKDALHDLRAWYLTEAYTKKQAVQKCMEFITEYYSEEGE